MRVIIQSRQLTIKDLKIGKLLKHYMEHNKVHILDSEKKIYKFLHDVVRDNCYIYKNYENILKKTHKNMTLAEIYYHILKQSDFIPLLYIASYHNGVYSNIEQLDYPTLNEMVNDLLIED